MTAEALASAEAAFMTADALASAEAAFMTAQADTTAPIPAAPPVEEYSS